MLKNIYSNSIDIDINFNGNYCNNLNINIYFDTDKKYYFANLSPTKRENKDGYTLDLHHIFSVPTYRQNLIYDVKRNCKSKRLEAMQVFNTNIKYIEKQLENIFGEYIKLTEIEL